ncbi:LytR family transcriptional regulator [Blastococcus sp. CT_GayMR20]|uniref:LytR C-terminal domain-containing protein n=1 Tax=Blastococcus sp. CT_GayMR20 TaxID=2559609 RepID=UPI0010740604|nr:LytR C-terminal domain-containing protein [Blastococcus sp. CT_GayMR20]TFV85887.1 LytR family transcriptional regulator [Blastococcus sp. CT_GayMR20]
MTLRTERPPVRPRSGRRPIPPLIFLLVLALAAAGVWWNVLRQEKQQAAEQEEACEAVEEAPASLDPATVNLRVFNATDTAGLATTVAEALRARGFVVDEIANDSSGREVTGVGELRHGPRGADAAEYVRLYVPGAGDFPDTRADGTVDVVVGPEFTTLATPEDVAAALAPVEGAPANCS